MNWTRIDNDLFWRDFEGRVLTFLRLKSSKLKLVGKEFFVKALILDHVYWKNIVVYLVEISLVEDFPINLERPNSSIFYLECLRNGSYMSLACAWAGLAIGWICDNSWHRQSWWDRVVVQTDLIKRYDNWAAWNVDSNRESDVRKAFDFWYNLVVKLAANIVVNCYSDGHFCIRKELPLVWGEDESYSFVVWKEESLLFFENLGLREGVSGDWGELLGLLMLIT